VRAGFFEIYRGKCADLLNKKKKIEVMEDEHGLQQMVGLQQAAHQITRTEPHPQP